MDSGKRSDKGVTRIESILAILLVFSLITSSIAAFYAITLSSEISKVNESLSDILNLLGGGTTTYRDTLIVGTTDYNINVEPSVVTGYYAHVLCAHMFDSLFRHEVETTEYHPWLATDLGTWVNPTTYEVNLRQNVKFHDGTPFNASCVKFSIERSLASGKGSSWILGAVNLLGVDVIDEFTVRFNLGEPFAAFPAVLASNPTAIVSPSAVAVYGTEFDRNPVGSGMYKFVSWTEREEFILEANEEYWNEDYIPETQNLVIKYFKDSSTLKLAIESGDVDIALRALTPVQIQSLRDNDDLTYISGYDPYVRFLAFRNQTPFDDIRVRQAIMHAINYEQLIEIGLKGLGYRETAPLPEEWPNSVNDQVILQTYNLDLARELLLEAGYPDGFETDLWHHLGTSRAEDPVIAAIIQQGLKAIGIEVTLKAADTASMMAAANQGQIPLWIWSNSFVYFDEFYMLEYFFGGGLMAKRMNYYPPDLNEMVAQFREEIDPEVSAELSKEIQRVGVQELMFLHLWRRYEYVFATKNVQGLKFGPVFPNINLEDILVIE